MVEEKNLKSIEKNYLSTIKETKVGSSGCNLCSNFLVITSL
jgi:hypothetical protein